MKNAGSKAKTSMNSVQLCSKEKEIFIDKNYGLLDCEVV
jgi:hypothetical protein